MTLISLAAVPVGLYAQNLVMTEMFTAVYATAAGAPSKDNWLVQSLTDELGNRFCLDSIALT